MGWGRFPARGRARVLHAELGGGGREHVTAVLALARTLVGEAGFAVERRPPHPHVTVARARGAAAAPRTAPWPGPPVPCLLDRLVLFESHPAPSGARYQPLEVQSWRLRYTDTVNWTKPDLDSAEVRRVANRYGVNLLVSSILVRRGLTDPVSVQYVMENDLRYLHNPFTLAHLEPAVQRILEAAAAANGCWCSATATWTASLRLR